MQPRQSSDCWRLKMKPLKAAGAVVIFATVPLLLSLSLSAQWQLKPDAGVPRTSTGQPNLTAPAPRTADGKPDLSGVWANPWATGGAGRGRGAAAPPPKVSLDEIPEASFGNVGVGFKDGLPLTPWAAGVLKQRMADNSKDNPDARCLPMGFMQFHEHPQFRKIVQSPAMI